MIGHKSGFKITWCEYITSCFADSHLYIQKKRVKLSLSISIFLTRASIKYKRASVQGKKDFLLKPSYLADISSHINDLNHTILRYGANKEETVEKLLTFKRKPTLRKRPEETGKIWQVSRIRMNESRKETLVGTNYIIIRLVTLEEKMDKHF